MRRACLAALLLLLGAVAAACGGGPEDAESSPATDPVTTAEDRPSAAPIPPEPPPTAPSPETRVGAPPPVDLTVSDVSLDDVVFDTFDGSFVALADASPALIEQLGDVIRPIYEPRYGQGSELGWLEDDDLVLGYEAGGQAYAYPMQSLNLRELVNDTIDGVPVLISYCPLCGSAVVFDRRLGEQTLLFGNTSALYQSDLVMFDHQSGSYWFQVAGRAIVGELSGSSLAVLPSFVATWSEWQALHPETVVLVGDSDGSLDSDRYARDSFDGYERVVDSGRFAFPVTCAVRDDRLRAAEVVVVIGAGGTEKAFPASALDAGANVEVGGGARARGSNARWRACGRVRPQARRARAQFRHGRLRARRS
jgi:hypothetical protein